ncbi:MAG: hypothetical protein AB1758_06395 [Candidatus Eremiobacterota bacterium]
MVQVQVGMQSFVGRHAAELPMRRAPEVPANRPPAEEPARSPHPVTVAPGALSAYWAQSRLQARMVQLATAR